MEDVIGEGMKWIIGFITGMVLMALLDKHKEKLYSYSDGKEWYMCDNKFTTCYTEKFKR